MAELAERLPEGAEEIVLGRRVSASGRTSAFVAGRAATAADLKLLGGRLLAFYGQHEHRRLTISSAQMDVLDGFAGEEQLRLRERYREAHRECLRLAATLAELRERDGSRERDLDLFRYELAEIEEVAPGSRRGGRAWRPSASGCATPRGCARPRRRRTRRRPAPTRTAAARPAPWPRPRRGCRRQPASIPPSTRSRERLGALALELGDAAAELRDYAEGVEADPGRLAAVEERLDALDRLQRKHGGSVESVLAHAERCREEIDATRGRRGARRRGARRPWPRPRRAARSSPPSSARPAPRPPAPLREEGRRGARAAGDAGGLAGGGPRAQPRRLRRRRRRVGRAADGAEPRHRRGAAPRRGLRRRAVARDARPLRAPGRRRRRRHAGLRRDRRRRRRQHGPRSSASGCGRSATAVR